MRHIRFTIALTTAASLAFGGCSSSTTSAPATGTYHIVSASDTLPHGHSWEDWQAMWWNWTYAVDSNHTPLNDTAPIDTLQNGYGHDGIWFLGGIYGPTFGQKRKVTTRTGVLPFGTALFFPVIN